MSRKLLNKLIASDCFSYLQKVDDNFADLIIIDPPYNLQKDDWDKFKDHQSFLEFTYRYIDLLVDKLKDSGSLYIFNTPYNAAFILRYLVEKDLYFQNWITWDKRDGLSYAKARFCRDQETIIFFSKSKTHTFNCDSVRIPYESTERIKHAEKKGILKNGKRWYPNSRGKLCGDVWHIVSERHRNKVNGKLQRQDHLTIKPLELVERIIRASSNEHDTVLDCFVGSGTTAVASRRLKRNFLCCDLKKEFISIAKKRLKNGA